VSNCQIELNCLIDMRLELAKCQIESVLPYRIAKSNCRNAKLNCRIELPNQVAKSSCQIKLPNRIAQSNCWIKLPNQTELSNRIAKLKCWIDLPNWIDLALPTTQLQVRVDIQNSGEVIQPSSGLIIAAFFFAMRSCEYTKPPKEGLTKRITLGNVTFRDCQKNIMKHWDPDLENKARYVMVRFEAQKNCEKRDVRTQRSTGDYVLCPVRRLARAVIRCRRSNLSVSTNTPICLFNGYQITSSFCQKTLEKDL
jgi:hypothetical protein